MSSEKIEGKYRIELLSPMNIPGGRAVISVEDGVLKGVYTENNKEQPMRDLADHGERITWTVSIGERGDESFVFTLKKYSDDLFMGGADAGMGASPVLARRETENLREVKELYVTVPSGPSGPPPAGPGGPPPLPSGAMPPRGMPPMGAKGKPEGKPPMGMPIGAGPAVESFKLDGLYLIENMNTSQLAFFSFQTSGEVITGKHINVANAEIKDIRCDGQQCEWSTNGKHYEFHMYHQNVLLGSDGVNPLAGRKISEDELKQYNC